MFLMNKKANGNQTEKKVFQCLFKKKKNRNKFMTSSKKTFKKKNITFASSFFSFNQCFSLANEKRL